jgi:hypothetical protein
MNETWQALSREAGLAAEHLAIGVSALGKASYSQHAYYGQAFFALTIGLERAAKLSLIVDHALQHNGIFPSPSIYCKYKHDIKKLLEQADEIATRQGRLNAKDRLPRTVVHDGIVEVLNDFATNITRYYNLDFVTRNTRIAKKDDPVRAWFRLVIIPIIDAYYSQRHKERHQQNAQIIAQLLGTHTTVLHHTETCDVLDSACEASMYTGVMEFAKPYTRMYVMQIVRFIARLLSELGSAANRSHLDKVPHFSEYFAIFGNSDEYFKQRKTWSIYRP